MLDVEKMYAYPNASNGASLQATKAYAEGKHLPTSQLDALQRLRDLQTIFEGRMMRLQPLLGLFHDY